MSDFAVTLKPVADLKPYERNARQHPRAQLDQIKDLIRLVGFTNPILEDERGIIAGHGRQMAALEMYEAGETIHGPGKRFPLPPGTVPVIDASGMSEAERRAYILADNQVALNATWDDRLVGLELQALKALEFDLQLVGFDDRAIVQFMAKPKTADPEEVPEAPTVPVSQPGDVWCLGDHHLICGDCTDPDTVATVLGMERPMLMVTDPPYGVEYDPAWRSSLDSVKRATGTVRNDEVADWRAAWALFPGDTAYVWHSGTHSGEVIASLEAHDFQLRAQIIWRKPHYAIGRGHYHHQHEPCFYAVRKGGAARWNGARDQSTIWDMANGTFQGGAAKEEDAKTGHGTQKPVEAMRRPMENNSKHGDAVYDPFMGSGTTIIAAEMTGRRAFGCELSPAYVDVIIQRWEKFTGKEAVLADGRARTFAAIAEERAAG